MSKSSEGSKEPAEKKVSSRKSVIERKSLSILNENRRAVGYLSLLNSMGYTIILKRPKKVKVKSLLPFLHIQKILAPNGEIIFSFEDVKSIAYKLKVGDGKTDQERRITQYIKNVEVNQMIETIIHSNLVFNCEEGAVKPCSINSEIPSQRRLESCVIFDGTDYRFLGFKEEQTVLYLDSLHKKLFEQASSNDFDVLPYTLTLRPTMQLMKTVISQTTSNKDLEKISRTIDQSLQNPSHSKWFSLYNDPTEFIDPNLSETTDN
ncbi:hypothetical protein ENUP19_0276G0021 [Entamoeba nuttalli]|uniref:Uncharacterized protein n=2 Tax=Entamoeba nuttalli TaxID=412467 RepID=K2HAN8_ENTNP|nr:hypothetical protein ENU1_119450 [Entamoeba nuttalli P19]EKE39664.1 hypothetical protein ENU1_119450 [Entamoeba nuttalli P19]|eukprot:XP_008858006.1 hypothetical protein ENU1_119450 [Entamoeba nuttalli P19]